jgi:hypothetical protein
VAAFVTDLGMVAAQLHMHDGVVDRFGLAVQEAAPTAGTVAASVHHVPGHGENVATALLPATGCFWVQAPAGNALQDCRVGRGSVGFQDELRCFSVRSEWRGEGEEIQVGRTEAHTEIACPLVVYR